MSYVSAKEYRNLSKIVEELKEMLPDFGVQLNSKEKGWDLFINIEGVFEPITYKFYLSYDSIVKYEPHYLAELIYDQMAIGYQD